MTFRINGVSFADCVARGGMKAERFDVSTQDTGRDTQTATYEKTVIAKKVKLTVTCRPLTAQRAAQLFDALAAPFMQVTFSSPFAGGEVTMTMYTDDHQASFLMERNGVPYWEGVEFPLIER